jgi:hypothetical protein
MGNLLHLTIGKAKSDFMCEVAFLSGGLSAEASVGDLADYFRYGFATGRIRWITIRLAICGRWAVSGQGAVSKGIMPPLSTHRS